MHLKHLTLATLCTLSATLYAETPTYKNANASVEDRIADLIQHMTLDEKIGQVSCPMGWDMYSKTATGIDVSDKFKGLIQTTPVGSLWAVLRADPWTQKTLETGVNSTEGALALNAIQHYAITHTRLGIPILFAEECAHGHMAIDATVFPTSLCQASTWNESLIYKMAEAIAAETRAQGATIAYGPVLDIARDPRWSRVEETFGEDPVLTSKLGEAFVRGLQGNDIKDGKHTYSTLKHFTAYGIPEGGHNGAQANVGMRRLLSEYMPAFKSAISAGAASVMTSYNSIDGIPCTSNEYLLTDILRKQWGFNGAVFSDLYSIDGIVGMRAANSIAEAASLALKAGVDIDLGANAYTNNIKDALDKGLIDISALDNAVANVLRLKFNMGLFENPYIDATKANAVINSHKHISLAEEIAAQGTILLKNNGILPLSNSIKKIAVIGPNADEIYNQLGDYTAPQDTSKVVTIYRGITNNAPQGTEVIFAKGCSIRDTTQSNISAAVETAKSADVVILALGGSSARDFKTQYINTGAATVDDNIVSDMDCGEGFDRCTLALLGDQTKLLEAIATTGKPMIVIYIQGRPLDMNMASKQADALLTAWYPGEQGGNAIAKIIFGEVNPAGRLPISIPRSEGQIPVYYSQENQRDYVELSGSPLYPFGYGLSYTKFEYSNLSISPGNGDTIQQISCEVKNIGDCDGDEVVQLYITDDVASVVQPPLLLKSFKRIHIKKGESKTLTFNLSNNDLAIYNRNLQQVVEPGTFTVKIGASSTDIRLEGSFTL